MTAYGVNDTSVTCGPAIKKTVGLDPMERFRKLLHDDFTTIGKRDRIDGKYNPIKLAVQWKESGIAYLTPERLILFSKEYHKMTQNMNL